MTEAPEKFVGGGVPRKEDPALVTGRANWTDNIKLPGMLHATLLMSPYAHAKITSHRRLGRQGAARRRRRLYGRTTSTTSTRSTRGRTRPPSPATT